MFAPVPRFIPLYLRHGINALAITCAQLLPSLGERVQAYETRLVKAVFIETNHAKQTALNSDPKYAVPLMSNGCRTASFVQRKSVLRKTPKALGELSASRIELLSNLICYPDSGLWTRVKKKFCYASHDINL
jgi:hypothetical protein